MFRITISCSFVGYQETYSHGDTDDPKRPHDEISLYRIITTMFAFNSNSHYIRESVEGPYEF